MYKSNPIHKKKGLLPKLNLLLATIKSFLDIINYFFG